MKTITIEQAARELLTYDNVAVLMHKSPDGDAIGCAYALCIALQRLGKKAKPFCSDAVPDKYSYITDGLILQDFEVERIVSVDLADERLFGDKLAPFTGRVDLCIDHHGSNTGFAKAGVIDPSAGACTQLIARLLPEMGVEIDSLLADAVFTGITTDTGCFRFSNATAQSYRIAADMIDRGAQSAYINRIMFDTKSRQRLALERMALDSLRFFCNDQAASVRLTREMMRLSGAEESDTDGIASIPRQIEGVRVGVTLREKEDGVFKISVRTTGEIDASAICAIFGGGGHKGAAGCSINGSADETERQIMDAVSKALESEV